ncbi:MAG: GNAT family protein [Alphaproteobacteria bacterium]|nr:GNAT family protein [Alphaproteobacteria bacterium]
MTNPIKTLPKIIKTARLEMRQLDATLENARIVFDAVKNENPADFYFNRICNTNLVPKTADEMLKQMQVEAVWVADNGVNLYIFHDGNLIGYRRLYFHDDPTKTLQMAAVWLVRSAWGNGFARETSDVIEKIAFETLGANRITRQCSADNIRSANSIKSSGFHLDGIARQGGVYPDNKLYDNMMWSKLKSEYNK